MSHDSKIVILSVMLALIVPSAIVILWAFLAGHHIDTTSTHGFTGGMDWTIIDRPMRKGDRVVWAGMIGVVDEFSPSGRIATVVMDNGKVMLIDADELQRVSPRKAA